ncbi:hypothetical protein [Paraherbaspirillum soli]|uniref:Bacterial toxin 24 domain-containing protein n=1 Tax=Paraherbaspirillum soli TaxID=631222 RepID=A0ABW0M638_9BURK
MVGVGVVALGATAMQVISCLQRFGQGVIDAEDDNDLIMAGFAFSNAVVLIGIDVVLAILLKKATIKVRRPGAAESKQTPEIKFIPQKPVAKTPAKELSTKPATVAGTTGNEISISGSKIHSKYPDGTLVMEGQQPGKITGPLKGSGGNTISEPHTVLQYDTSNRRIYKGREYGNDGIPIRDLDFTHPTFPNGTLRPNHTVPEQHLYIPNDPLNPKAGYKRGPGQPF